MSYTLIKGTFHIFYPENPRSGPEPDGDTIKFKPDNRQLIEKLPRPNMPAKFNLDGITTIRLEGIDALETHFSVEGDEFHQQMDFALESRDSFLNEMGFGEIRYFADRKFKVQSVENHPVRGYILSNGIDTYGRTIAFVYTGEHAAADGSGIFVLPDMLNASINAYMLANGFAYAAFYLTLPAELRDHLREIVVAARNADVGLWPNATVTISQSAVISGLAQLQELVIWPKLFRRLAAYFQSGFNDLSMLQTWLREDPINRDDRLLLLNRELGNMHDLIIVKGDTLRLAYEPEDVVIVPDDYTLNTGPVTSPITLRGAIRIVAALIDATGPAERGRETITILNTTADNINLKGLFIAEKQSRHALDGTLAGGEAVRVKLSSKMPLSNLRGNIMIIDDDEKIIDKVTYESRNLPEEGYTMVF